MIEFTEAFDRFFGSKVQPTIVELIGAEAMQQGSPPEIKDWELHNHNAG
jgi:hypothetical protein